MFCFGMINSNLSFFGLSYSASLRRRFFFLVPEIAGVLFAGGGLCRAAFFCWGTDRPEGQMTDLDGGLQIAGLVAFVDPDALRLVLLQLADRVESSFYSRRMAAGFRTASFFLRALQASFCLQNA